MPEEGVLCLVNISYGTCGSLIFGSGANRSVWTRTFCQTELTAASKNSCFVLSIFIFFIKTSASHMMRLLAFSYVAANADGNHGNYLS